MKNSFHLCKQQVINYICNLFGLLYHTTVDRKDILAGAILSAPMYLINYYAPNASYCEF